MEEHMNAVYWHRELPPFEAQALGEHVLETNSRRIPDTIERREELWNQSKDELMAHTNRRLLDEIRRLGGRYAHVLNESIDTKHDPRTGEAWLCGRVTYVLYR
jgi:hypothetical protein